MEWIFGQRYDNVTTRTVRPCSADEARARHHTGADCAAVLRDPETDLTLAGIEVSTDAHVAVVSFLDGAGRLYLRCVFGPAEDGEQMFWQRAHFIEYADEAAKQFSASETRHNREDSRVHCERSDKVNDTYTTREGAGGASDRHYEPVPAFGDYLSIFRVDRDKGVDEQSEVSPSWSAGETPIPWSRSPGPARARRPLLAA